MNLVDVSDSESLHSIRTGTPLPMLPKLIHVHHGVINIIITIIIIIIIILIIIIIIIINNF